MEEYYEKDMNEGNVSCYRGANDIFVKIHELFKENAAFCLMDDYIANNELSRGNNGKLF